MSLNICPECFAKALVIDSRWVKDHIRRRYACDNGHRYSTVELVVGSGKGHVPVSYADEMEQALRQAMNEWCEKWLS